MCPPTPETKSILVDLSPGQIKYMPGNQLHRSTKGFFFFFFLRIGYWIFQKRIDTMKCSFMLSKMLLLLLSCFSHV